MDRFGIVIQARLGSTRFPRKIGKRAGGATLLEMCVACAREVPHADVLVCAPDDERDDEFWRSFDACPVFYGSHGNLLMRYLEAARSAGMTDVVRLTADNPRFSVRTVTSVIDFMRKHGLDYVSAKKDDGAMLPYGVGCEAFTAAALARVSSSADPVHQEHVSEAFLENPDMRTGVLFKPLDFCTVRTKDLSLTVDHPEQWELLVELGFVS